MIHSPFAARRILAAACLVLGGALGGALGGVLGGATAQAQEGEGDWYIGASLPLMFIDDSESLTTTVFGEGEGAPTLRSKVTSEHDTGFKLGGSIGYQLDSGVRLEGELFIARADVSKLTHSDISISGLPLDVEVDEQVPIAVSGTADQLGALVNIMFDIDTGSDWTPYIGGGVGWVRIDNGDLSYDTNAVADRIGDELESQLKAQESALRKKGAALAKEGAILQAQQDLIDDNMLPTIPPEELMQRNAALMKGLEELKAAEADLKKLGQELGGLSGAEVPRISAEDSVLAYQISAGVGYALSDTATLQFGYRYQAVDGLEFHGSNDMVSTRSETDLKIHFFEIGIRQLF